MIIVVVDGTVIAELALFIEEKDLRDPFRPVGPCHGLGCVCTPFRP